MKIISNLAISLDGKIAPAHPGFFKLGTETDWKKMQELRGEVDAVIFGASTLRAYKGFAATPDRDGPQPANVIISSKLEGLSLSSPFFKRADRKRILVTTKPVPKSVATRFSKVSELLALKPAQKKNVARAIVSELRKRGMKTLLVEGGGSLMWEFAKENLIDEYHLTLTPRLLGGKAAPTLIEGEGFKPAKALNLKLVEARVVGDEIFLVYRSTAKRGLN